MTTINIMLDLETWGKRPGCDIRSIGACVFDPLTGFVHDGSLGTIKPFYLATDNPITTIMHDVYRGYDEDAKRGIFADIPQYKYPLFRDPETFQWWNDQSEEARAAFADPVDLREALQRFANWLAMFDTGYNFEKQQCSAAVHLWAHGPSFDVSILEAVYHAVNLPVPWHYRAPRDTRTAFDIADVGDHSAWMQQFNHGTAHHALDDAISQAKAVCGAFEIVRGWKHGHDDNEAELNRAHLYEPTRNSGKSIMHTVIPGWLADIIPPAPNNCPLPPKGWYCTRDSGHDGPCAARLMTNFDDGK